MKKRIGWLRRIDSVWRQVEVISLALDSFQEMLDSNPSLLKTKKLSRADLRQLREEINETFTVRMFAEFERGLRQVWQHFLKRSTIPKTKDLLDGLASKRKIPPELFDEVHEVRELRNAIVHESDAIPQSIHLSEIRRRLCKYLSHMPLDW